MSFRECYTCCCMCLSVVKHREARLKQELDSMTQQNDWLDKEIQEKTADLMASRKEKVSCII
jgi:C4-dicarboxylate-specific signal transduction histidine kinase